MNILITGCCGFIGFHLSLKLINKKNFNLVGIDNMNSYYDLSLKKNRLKILKSSNKNFKFIKQDITKKNSLRKLFKNNKFTHVIHLAAQAGVRYSILNPDTYVSNNINGFFNVLDLSKEFKIKHLIFASTSSVYGKSESFPLFEKYETDSPLSFYAATKKSNEVMAYAYSNINKLACTGLRFFTVYGPYGRPDMALFKFVDSINKSKSISLYNKGDHIRDFTYVDDVVKSIEKLIQKPSNKKIPYDIFNIGCSKPQTLKKFVKLIEDNLGKKAKIKFLGLQKGDVHKTHASIKKLEKKIGFDAKTNIEEGIKKFIEWYKYYYQI